MQGPKFKILKLCYQTLETTQTGILCHALRTAFEKCLITNLSLVTTSSGDIVLLLLLLLLYHSNCEAFH